MDGALQWHTARRNVSADDVWGKVKGLNAIRTGVGKT